MALIGNISLIQIGALGPETGGSSVINLQSGLTRRCLLQFCFAAKGAFYLVSKKYEGLFFDWEKCYDSLCDSGSGALGNVPEVLHCMRFSRHEAS